MHQRTGWIGTIAAVMLAAALAAEARPPACPGGRFLAAGPLVPDSPAASDGLVLLDGNASLGATCPVTPVRVRGKRRFDLVKGRFDGCTGPHPTIKLAARIDAATCRTMKGTLVAKRPKPRLLEWFTASIPAGGSVGGALVVPPTAFADVDTADPAQNGDNDSLATAQPIPSFGTVGGAAYIADAASYDDDYYRIELDGHPLRITLAIANPENADLDLFLVDESGNSIVEPSRGTADLEELVTDTQTGTAYVGVVTYLGPAGAAPDPITNYVLSIGQAGGTGIPGGGAAADAPSLPATVAPDAEIVPGEVIVRLRDDVPMVAQGRLALAADDATHVTGDPCGRGGGLFRLSPPRTLAAATATDRKAATLAAVAEMRRRPDVVWAEPNYVRHALRTPNDELYEFQWHYPIIALPEAWDITTGSADVIVAVIDTGLLVGHPDIAASRLVPGYDFILDPSAARDGTGIDPDPFDDGDLANGSSSSFHGTHVAGTVGAATDNGAGVAGVDWAARIMPIRVLGAGGGTAYDIAQGIRFAAGLPNDSGTVPAARADVINMSLGGPGASQTERAAIQDARAAGVAIVVAAGNSNEDAAGFSPASFPECVTVSAADLRRAKAPYSNFGSVVDLAAPGGDTSIDRNGDGFADGILSTLGDDSGADIVPSYVFYQGTSMASPHVAGVAALMQAAFMAANGGARYTPAELDAWIAAGLVTDDLGPTNWAGTGLVNARKAVEAAGGVATGPPTLIAIPTAVSFGGDLDTTTVLLRNGGTGTVSVTSVAAPPDVAWLGIATDVPLPASAPVTVTLTVDRSALSPGLYTTTVTATSDAGVRTIPVALTAGAVAGGGDVGPVYVLLVDPASRRTLFQAESNAAGAYLLEFAGEVPAGSYRLVAGTDRDNDGFVGDPGEAFGLYPTTDQARLFDVPGAGAAVFPVVEQVSIPAGASAGSATPPPDGFRRLR